MNDSHIPMNHDLPVIFLAASANFAIPSYVLLLVFLSLH